MSWEKPSEVTEGGFGCKYQNTFNTLSLVYVIMQRINNTSAFWKNFTISNCSQSKADCALWKQIIPTIHVT